MFNGYCLLFSVVSFHSRINEPLEEDTWLVKVTRKNTHERIHSEIHRHIYRQPTVRIIYFDCSPFFSSL